MTATPCPTPGTGARPVVARVEGVVAHDGLGEAATHLEHRLVTETGAQAVLDDPQRTAREAQREHGGVGLAQLGEARVEHGGPAGEDLLDRPTHCKGQIGVVAEGVVEDAGRPPHALQVGPVGVGGHRAHGLHRAERAVTQEPQQARDAGVEAPLKADLERRVGGTQGIRHARGVRELGGQRLLAEDRLAGAGRGDDDVGVGLCGGGDRYGVDAVAVGLSQVAGSPRARGPGGDCLRSGEVLVDHQRQACPHQRRQGSAEGLRRCHGARPRPSGQA